MQTHKASEARPGGRGGLLGWAARDSSMLADYGGRSYTTRAKEEARRTAQPGFTGRVRCWEKRWVKQGHLTVFSWVRKTERSDPAEQQPAVLSSQSGISEDSWFPVAKRPRPTPDQIGDDDETAGIGATGPGAESESAAGADRLSAAYQPYASEAKAPAEEE